MAKLHQSDEHPPQFTRFITDQEMNPFAEKLKKRKFFTEDTGESSLPAAKHKCHDTTITSEDNSSLTNSRNDDMDLMDTQVDSGQDSSSFPGDSQLSPRVKFNKFDKTDYVGWDDNDDADSLGECINEEYYSENNQQKGGLEEFLSCSGMNPNLYAISGERWSVDQETQLGRQKPTIDQEFEQYFSTLML